MYDSNRDQHNEISKEYSIQRIDKDIAERIPYEIDPDFGILWPNSEEFMDHSVGHCILCQNTIVSISFSGFKVDWKMEIGAATKRLFRNQGFARIVTSILIDWCIKQNVEPFISTNKGNISANSVVQKLKFGQPALYHWICINNS